MGAFIGSTKGPLVFLDSTQTAATFVQKLNGPHWQLFYNYMVKEPYIRTCNCIALMEDGASIHTAQIFNKWWATNQIKKLPWPAHSPDLNLIENVWKVLKTHVTKHHQPCTMDELHSAIKSAWDDLSPTFFEKLLIGIHKPMEEVVESHGGPRDSSTFNFSTCNITLISEMDSQGSIFISYESG
ncbi:hypothetical protein O181_023320 [Austropuccinia psidii MF-1]|uniref:Tc1-like transposase DDE domain-containing protein n=1 Tax=Austropuccinia psidii MF-1 TaxID=1389203 RepID=A0A9Q3CI94_9BASI|nr:hypothetical protein [Austropuccinia psidii MF-1]